MDLLIRLCREQPPAGVVRPLPERDSEPDGAELPFAGWLELLRVLAQVLGEPE